MEHWGYVHICKDPMILWLAALQLQVIFWQLGIHPVVHLGWSWMDVDSTTWGVFVYSKIRVLHVTSCHIVYIYIYISYGIISPSYPHHLLPYHGRPSSQVDSPFVAKRSRRRNCSWPRRWSYSPFCKRRISSTWPSVARLVWGGYNVANKTHSECTWLIGWDMI